MRSLSRGPNIELTIQDAECPEAKQPTLCVLSTQPVLTGVWETLDVEGRVAAQEQPAHSPRLPTGATLRTASSATSQADAGVPMEALGQHDGEQQLLDSRRRPSADHE